MTTSALSAETLALTRATIYPSPTEDAIRDGTVLIRDGKIAAVGARGAVAIPPGTQTLDCSGLMITAGFWNSHVHFFERKWGNAGEIPAAELARQLQEMLTRYGFTTAFDLSSTWENTRRLRDRIESGEVPGPRIRSTGEGLLPPEAGLPPDIAMRMMGLMKTSLHEVADEAQAADAARKLIAAGVDGIKLFVSGPSKAALSEGTIRGAVEAAHQAGKPVFIHPNSVEDVLAGVRGGVDVVGHTTPMSAWSDTVLSEMKAHRVALIPTLQVWKYNFRHDRASTLDQALRTCAVQLRAWVESGGTVIFGTDVGYVDYDPSDEYALMAQAGMNERQILASLTTAPAERFGQGRQLGRIAPGFEADLVVLKSLHEWTSVRYTVRAGRIIYRAM